MTRHPAAEPSAHEGFVPDAPIRCRDFRIGAIGAGFIMADVQLAAYREAGFPVVAIASRTPAKAAQVAQRHGIATVHETPEALIRDPQVQIVDIAYPPDQQPALIRLALAQPHVKGVLAQKPLALDLETARALAEEAQRAGKPLSVNQNMRFDQSMRVSAQTVSRVLRDPAGCTPETRERVEAAIRSTRDVQNLAASHLASNRSMTVAAVIPQIAASVFAETLQGLSNVLLQAGYQVIIGHSDYSHEREEDVVRSLLGRRPDAFFLVGTRHTDAVREMLQRAAIPVVETWAWTRKPIDQLVGFSNHEAIAAAVAYVQRRGYARPVFVAAARPGDDRARERLEGYVSGMARHYAGQPARSVVMEDLPYTMGSGRARRPAARAVSGQRRAAVLQRPAGRRRAAGLPAPGHRSAAPAGHRRLRRLRGRARTQSRADHGGRAHGAHGRGGRAHAGAAAARRAGGGAPARSGLRADRARQRLSPFCVFSQVVIAVELCHPPHQCQAP